MAKKATIKSKQYALSSLEKVLILDALKLRQQTYEDSQVTDVFSEVRQNLINYLNDR